MDMALERSAIYTTEEVAEYLRVSPKTVYRLIEKGELPASRVGRQYRVSQSDIDVFLALTSTSEEALDALFERVAAVARRQDFDTQEIERDIAEAIEAVRRSGE
jgi:excisionase family DNA binding protein